MRRWFAVLVLAIGLPGGALAGATLIYDGDGRVQRVVREGPSGPIVYDRQGRLLSAVREGDRSVGLVVRIDRRGRQALGTTLSGGVGDN